MERIGVVGTKSSVEPWDSVIDLTNERIGELEASFEEITKSMTLER